MAAKTLKDIEALGVTYIKVPNLSSKESSKTFERELQQHLVSTHEHFVLDFEGAITVPQEAMTFMVKFRTLLIKAEKHIYSINVGQNVLNELKARGLDRSFGICKDLDEVAKKAAPAPLPNLNAFLLKEFIQGASKAFEVQVGVKIEPLKFFSKKHQFEELDAVAGQVQVDTSGFSGTISICFQKPVFLAIYKALLNEDLSDINDDNKDAAGELVNMIYGHAKTALNSSMGLALKPALPKVIVSPKPIESTNPVIVVPFNSTVGEFRIEIQIL